MAVVAPAVENAGEARGMKLSALVVCQDAEGVLGACLASLGFADEIVVVDGGSCDGTLEVAAAYGARVLRRPFDTINAQKDWGRQCCRGEWVFNLDADEVAAPGTGAAVRAYIGAAVGGAARVRRRNYFRGRWLRFGGPGRDAPVRLWHRASVWLDTAGGAHDRVRVVDGGVGRVAGEIRHYLDAPAEALRRKEAVYGRVSAEAAAAAGRRAGLWVAWVRPLGRFCKHYGWHLGFLDGMAGLAFALSSARECRMKYNCLRALTGAHTV